MNPEQQSKELIDLLGYKKAVKLVKTSMFVAKNDFEWHKWFAVLYNLKKQKK